MHMEKERPPHPGVILKERFLEPLGITPADLASHIAVSIRRVQSLLRGRSGISTEMAIRLGLFFRVPPAWWLDLQSQYETEGVPLMDKLREQVQPWGGLEHVLVGPRGVRILQPSPKPEAGPILVPISRELMERLRAQAALGKPHPPRQVRMVTYENGAVALVGSDE
jgi:addiction module HigA family antidote